jgi:hypothetical protein
MQTNIEVANSALLDINVEEITGFNDPSKQARVTKAKFQSSINRVLSMGPWICNRTFAILNQAGDTETYGWDYVFNLPNDHLYTRAVIPTNSLNVITAETMQRLTEYSMGSDSNLYMQVGKKIYSNTRDITIVYSRSIKDCTQLPEYVLAPIVKLLAAEIVFPLTQDRQMRADQLTFYMDELKIARALNAREENTAVPIASSITVRS